MSITLRDKAELGVPFNYIKNGGAESTTSGWATYANTAANIPSTGTGGSPSSTWTSTTSSPLAGNASFLWTKAGSANRQGEGVAYAFTINTCDQANMLQISFDYAVVSGTFTASNGSTTPLNDGTTSTNAGNSDLEIFIYDVTNSQLIYVNPQVLTASSSLAFKFVGTFQTNSNSTSYRLIIHTATTTTNNYVVKFDNFVVSSQRGFVSANVPAASAYGASTTISTATTVIWPNVVYDTNACYNASTGEYTVKVAGKYKVSAFLIGPSLNWTAGSTFDVRLYKNGSVYQAIGVTYAQTTYSANRLAVGGSTEVSCNVGDVLTVRSTQISSAALDVTSQENNWVTFEYLTNSSSDSLSGQVIDFVATLNSGSHTSSGSWQNLPSLTKVIDTVGGFNGTTTYTFQVSGNYKLTSKVGFASNATGVRGVRVLQNGSTINGGASLTPSAGTTGVSTSNSIDILAKAGDTITWQSYQDSGGTLTYETATDAQTVVCISKIGSSSNNYQNSIVTAQATNSTNQTTNSTTPINFNSTTYDTAAAISTGPWKYTAQTSGWYDVFISSMYTTSATDNVALFKNGTSYTNIMQVNSSVISSGSIQVQLNAGDYIDLRTNASVTIVTGAIIIVSKR